MKARTLLALAATLLAAACDSSNGSGPVDPRPQPKPVASVEVSPGAITLTRGTVRALEATLRAADGSPLEGRMVTWTSTNEAVATVDAAGRVTALAAGTTVITAASEGRTGRAEVTVAPPAVTWVEMRPGASVSVHLGRTTQLTAVPRGADMSELPDRTVTWSSGDERVATVSATGLVTARDIGQAIITATSEGKTGQVIVFASSPVTWVEMSQTALVLLVNENGQLDATPRTATNEAVNRPETWTSSNDAVATVTPYGMVTARGVGTATITATVDGKRGITTVIVAAPTDHALRTVAGMPVPAEVYTTTETDASGTVRTVRWMVRDGVLRLYGGNRYEHRLTVWIFREGQAVIAGQYVDRGTYHWLAMPRFVFNSYTGASFEGRMLEGGGWSLTRRIDQGHPEVTFVHAAP